MREADMERELAEQLPSLQFPPAALTLREFGPCLPEGHAQGLLTARWRDQDQTYACQLNPLNTPRAVQIAAFQARLHAHPHGISPLIIVPYLSEKRLRELQEIGVSGLDLCGNGLLLGPHFSIWRSGQPNRFPESQPVRNVFRGSSAIFARCFLLHREFPTLTHLRQYALDHSARSGSEPHGRGAPTIGTASKVVQSLEQQMLVTRQGNRLTLLDPAGLMQGLLENHRPSVGPRLEGRSALPAEVIWSRLWGPETPARLRSITTGLGSAVHYGATSSLGRMSLYVSDLAAAADLLDLKETRVFPELELVQETSDLVYFDARSDQGILWASPIQAWLELASAGPRERDAARIMEVALRNQTMEGAS